MIYFCNTFSLHMLPQMKCGKTANVRVERISTGQVRQMLKGNAWKSYYGHESSVRILGKYLDIFIPVYRGTLRLGPRDILIVAAMDSKRKWEIGYALYPGWKFYMIACDLEEM